MPNGLYRSLRRVLARPNVRSRFILSSLLLLASFIVSPIAYAAPPVADAGADQSIEDGQTVTLDGSASVDNDGTIVSYEWLEGTTSLATTAMPSISGLGIGTHTIDLVVTDNDNETDTDTVVVTVTAANAPPTADAGSDQTIEAGQAAVMDGSNSIDSDGTISTYEWFDGATSLATGATPSITGLTVGTYTLDLVVTDNDGATGTDAVVVTVTAANAPPTADAGSDQTIEAGQAAVMDGSNSIDSDGTISTYEWFDGATSLATGATPSITGLTVGTYTIDLVVTDNDGATGTDAVVVTVTAANAPPTADAGSDQTIEAGQAAVMDGSNSIDSDGTISTYEWFDGATSLATGATPSITGLTVGTYTLDLVVTDNDGATGTDAVVVTVTAANAPPTADAGSDQTIEAGQAAVMDGSNSIDSDGTISTYEWFDGATSLATGATPSITGLTVGTYTLDLVVTDNDGATGTDAVVVTVTAANAPPTADAGSDQTIEAGQAAVMDGSNSIDSDGTISTYEWFDGATSLATGATPSITGLTVGTYTLDLVVTDNDGATGTDAVVVTVTAANAPPTADAGSDQTIEAGQAAVMDGSNSIDSDGTISTYEWFDGATSLATGATPSITGLTVGTYTIDLVVTDNDGATGTDAVVVTVTASNAPPTADAGSDQTIEAGQAAVMDGSNSIDSDGTISTYEWFDGATSLATGATPSITGLTVGTYTLDLVVTDNDGATGTDAVVVTVTAGNLPPVADAGADLSIADGQSATLDGSNSTDADGTISTYEWFDGATSLATGATPTIAGLGVGTHTIDLVVTDNDGATGTDAVVVTVTAGNLPPVADAGADLSIADGQSATLDGSNSTDADGTISTYEWFDGATSLATGATPTIAGLGVGTHSIDLVVTDNEGATGTDAVVVTVTAANSPPTANAGPDQTIEEGQSASLDGSGSTDSDGTIATYEWFDGATSLATGATPSIRDLTVGTHTLDLVVTDNNGATDTDSVVITVTAANQPPVADAGADLSITDGQSAALDGSNSTDSDGTISTYEWFDGATSLATGATPTITGLGVGTHTIDLVVTDNEGATGTDAVVVTVNASGGSSTVYEDAEHGNIAAWTVYDNAPTGATVTNVFDADNGSLVIDLSGSGVANGYAIGGLTANDGWNNTSQFVLSWQMQVSSGFRFYVRVDTLNGPRYLYYTASNSDLGLSGIYVRHGLGSQSIDGTWQSYQRDLEQDLLEFEPSNALIAVQGIRIRADMRVDDIELSATAAGNTPPVADAGADLSIADGQSAALDGSNSTDSDGTISTYEWFDGATSLATGATPTIAGLGVGTHTIDLVVTDNEGATGTDAVVVTVTAGNLPPVADAGADLSIADGQSAALDGSNSTDADGTISTYEWFDGATSLATGATPSIAGLGVGTYTIDLVVTDNDGATGTDAVVVTVTAGNLPPVADAGADLSITDGQSATLDGSNSTDADGTISTYEWFDGATSLATGATPTITGLGVGTYTIDLVVTDNDGATGTDAVVVTVTAGNLPPVADAGADLSIADGQSATLDGSNSTDADGTISTYEWFDGATSLATGATPTIAGLGVGTYTIDLVVTDNDGATGTDAVVVTVTAGNLPPVADAGADLSITDGQSAALDGSNSTDADGTISTYEWFDGATSLATGATPTITGLSVGTYTIDLVVTDNEGATGTDAVVVTVIASGGSSTVYEDAEHGNIAAWTVYDNAPTGATVTNVFDADNGSLVIDLSGSGVANGYAIGGLTANDGWNNTSQFVLSWQMQVSSGFRFYVRVDTLNGPRYLYYTASNSDLGLSGIYVRHGLGSQSIDGTWQSYQRDLEQDLLEFEPSNALIAVQGIRIRADMRVDDIELSATAAGNTPPVADAGADLSIADGQSAALDGSNSTDADGTISTYEWFDGATSLATGATPSIAGLGVGTYTIDLVVTDNDGATGTDAVVVTVTAGNLPPVADAGADLSIADGQSAALDGSNSTDADGTISTYEWFDGATSLATGATPTIAGLGVGTYTIDLVVTDNDGATGTDAVVVTVTAGNLPPVADAGADLSIADGQSAALDGSNSTDADGTISTYEWFDGATSLATGATPTIAGLGVGTYTIDLVVTDNDGATGTDAVVVTVTAGNLPPVADAGADLSITDGQSAALDGSNSTDADGTISTYEWFDGATSLATGATPTITGLGVGTYTIDLVVTDNEGATGTDAVVVTVNASGGSSTVYEDAEHGNIAAWTVYDNAPTGATVTNVFDADNGSLVIDLSGSGVANGYAIGGLTANDGWNNTSQFVLSWQMQVSSGFRFYVRVDTLNGPRYLYYTASNSDLGLSGIYVRHGLGSQSIDGTWQSYQRDLEQDLLEFEPSNALIAVQGIRIRADMRVDDIELSATAAGNTPPVADAGADLSIADGQSAALDGSNSTDSDGTISTYEWFDGATSLATGATPTIAGLGVGTHTIDLVVTDNEGATGTDAVIVTVTSGNIPPVADAGADQSIQIGQSASLDGSNSTDADGTISTYEWFDGATSLATGATPTITGLAAGTHTIDLVVTDDGGATATDAMIVTVTDPNMPLAIATGLLNDTGTRIGGSSPSGNNSNCASGDVLSQQDCSLGRDATAANGNLVKTGHGSNGFDFTKIDGQGSALPQSATQWSCVLDNHTGLMWEVKTAGTSSLHAAADTFTLYNTDPNTNGGSNGADGASNNSCDGYVAGAPTTYCNTEAFVNRVNAEGWCGYSNWRMPNYLEKLSIMDLSAFLPAIDTNLFPNTADTYYWTSNPVVANNLQSWNVRARTGYASNRNNTVQNGVRLVRTE